jgi:uncharacterized membrane protein YozB (DUF420 family)
MTTKTIIIISSAVVLATGIFLLIKNKRQRHKNFDGIDFGVPNHLLTPNW